MKINKDTVQSVYLAACWTTESGKSGQSRQSNEWYSYISISSDTFSRHTSQQYNNTIQ